MQKIAFFDFCETLVSFQTADRFVDFVSNQKKTKNGFYFKMIGTLARKFYIVHLFNKFAPYFSFSKKIKLLELRGIEKTTLNQLAEEFYFQVVRPKLIPTLVSEIQKKKQEGFLIVLVSGGYSIYLKKFAEEFEITHVVATDIAFDKKGRCKGLIKGIDCLFHFKIKKLSQEFNLDGTDLKNSIAYSDSITDLPLLQFVGHGIVVSNQFSQSWANKYGFSEIIF